MEGLNKSLSDTELDVSMQMAPQVTPPNAYYVTSRRNKKTETNFSAELAVLREEMKNMFASLMSSQNRDFQKFENTLKAIQATNQSIENSITFLTTQNKDFQEKIIKLEDRIKQDRKYITVLEDKIEDMQRNNRKTNIELKNVPKKAGESKDDLVGMFLHLSKTIGCEATKSDIKDIYRISNKRNDKQNPPIIIETSSTLFKTDLLKTCKTFNIKNKNKLSAKHVGCNTEVDNPIFVSEQLTSKASRLYFLARDLVKTRSYRFCWTAYGKVYVRKEEHSKIILITSEAQIQQLINEK